MVLSPRVAAAATLLLPALLLCSCASTAPPGAAGVRDGRYDSEFPHEPVSRYLEEISESVLRLNAIGYYKTYTLGSRERLRVSDLTPAILGGHENTSVYSSSTTSGTATVICSSGRTIGLLTCAHVVTFPETVYTYQDGPDRRQTEFLSAVSIRKRVSLYIATLPEGGTVELLAADMTLDLAVVGHTYETAPPFLPRALRYPLGNSGDLDWGTFVYLFGYPTGNRVVTKGIVSSPNKDKRHSFLVDAVFGRGFSGGICLALRDGVPNFEVVGLIKMVSGRTSYVVTPGKDRVPEDLDIEVPYTGQLYLERRTEIDYGVTQALSAEMVRSFLQEQRNSLANRGFVVDRVLGEGTGS